VAVYVMQSCKAGINVRQEPAVKSRVRVGGATVRYCHAEIDTEMGGKAGMESDGRSRRG
jgi:hypothetical protein